MNYTIQPGDTLSQIAEKYNVSQQDIVDLNGSLKGHEDTILAGDNLTLPDNAKLDVTGEDAASAAANNADSENDDSVVQSCPLQGGLFTLKPLRYTAVHEDNESQLPEDLITTKELTPLNEHKYNLRQLYYQVVYLYNIKDKYLLEVEYEDGEPAKQDNFVEQGPGRCLFGSAPGYVTNTLPYLSQPRNAQVVMWISPTKLSERWIKALEDNPDEVINQGQFFDFEKAAKGEQPDVYAYTDDTVGNLLADAQVTQPIHWTNPTIDPLSEFNIKKLLQPYQKISPNNHYAVCLIDAIGITSDLCREFSASYQAVIQAVGRSTHPYIMGKLTQKVIEKASRESTQGLESIGHRVDSLYKPYPEYVDDLFQLQLLPVKEQSAYKQQILKKIQAAKSNKSEEELYEILENDRISLNPYPDFQQDQRKYWQLTGSEQEAFKQQISDKRLAAIEAQSKINSQNLANAEYRTYQEKKEDLEDTIYKDEMEQYLQDHESFHKQVGERLETLAKDWLIWVRHDQSDLALTRFDPLDIKTYADREIAVLSMIDSFNVTEVGTAEIQSWVDAWLVALQENNPKELKGVGAHVALAIGWVTDTYMANSKAIGFLSKFAGAGEDKIQKMRDMIANANYPATVNTDELIYTYIGNLVKISVADVKNKILTSSFVQTLSSRYGYNYQLVKVKVGRFLSRLAKDQSNHVSTLTNNGTVNPKEIPELENKTVELYNLSERVAKDASNDPIYVTDANSKALIAFVGQRAVSKGLKPIAKFSVAANDFLKKYDGKLFGMIVVAQIINAYRVIGEIDNTDKSKLRVTFDVIKASSDLMSGSIGLLERWRKKKGLQTLGKYVKDKRVDELSIRALSKVDKKIGAIINSKIDVEIFQSSPLLKNITSKSIVFCVKGLPVIGALTGFISSLTSYEKDKATSQNTFAKTMAITSTIANFVNLGLVLAGLFWELSGPFASALFLVFVIALAADLIHAVVEDHRLYTLLKQSLWGKGNYKYQESLSDLEQKIQFFAEYGNDSHNSLDDKIEKVESDELSDFCDELYRPVAILFKQNTDNVYELKGVDGKKKYLPSLKGINHRVKHRTIKLSNFQLSFYLPFYEKGISGLSVNLQGYASGDKKELLSGQTSSQGLVWQTDLISKATLDDKSYRHAAVFHLEINEKIRSNYSDYDLVLKFSNPAGYPVTLSYTINLDNDKNPLSFWRDEVDFDMNRSKEVG